MNNTLKCPLTEKISSCPAVPLLCAILEKVERIYQLAKEAETEQSSKITLHRPHVGLLVLALQIKYPVKAWTAEEFAKKIGCTASAVRHTEEWKNYQKRLQYEKKERLSRKEYKDKYGNIESFDGDLEEGNF